MRVLLDESLPHDLIEALSGHSVLTVQGLGWAGAKNGDLLKRATGHIDALVTMDRRLEREHDLSGLPLGSSSSVRVPIAFQISCLLLRKRSQRWNGLDLARLNALVLSAGAAVI